MGWKPDYVTAAQVKSWLRITDTNDDTVIGYAITAASRAIDQYCGRQFGELAAPTARLYTPIYQPGPVAGNNLMTPAILLYSWALGRFVINVDDIMTTTGLVVKIDDGSLTYPNTLTLNVDYFLHPWNADGNLVPWTQIVTLPGADLSFRGLPLRERSVQVTASFGWTSIPAEVTQACLIQASRFFMRRNAPFGVAGSPEYGSEVRLLSRLDPDVQMLLSSVVRYWGGV